MAYALLGLNSAYLSQTGLAALNTRKAYELRERVSQRDKFFIESNYYFLVLGDLEKARQAYELWAQIYQFGWATPEGWRNGLRPPQREADSPKSSTPNRTNAETPAGKNGNEALDPSLIPEIEAMAERLGKGLYRGLLKTVARAWTPTQIKDVALRKKVLEHMQAAERGLRRLEAAIDKVGPKPLFAILESLKFSSLERVDNLTTLHEIVMAMEAKGAR